MGIGVFNFHLPFAIRPATGQTHETTFVHFSRGPCYSFLQLHLFVGNAVSPHARRNLSCAARPDHCVAFRGIIANCHGEVTAMKSADGNVTQNSRK